MTWRFVRKSAEGFASTACCFSFMTSNGHILPCHSSMCMQRHADSMRWLARQVLYDGEVYVCKEFLGKEEMQKRYMMKRYILLD